jgi:hypothetical protein
MNAACDLLIEQGRAKIVDGKITVNRSVNYTLQNANKRQ